MAKFKEIFGKVSHTAKIAVYVFMTIRIITAIAYRIYIINTNKNV